MKKMKNNLRLILLAITTSIALFSCSNESLIEETNENTNSKLASALETCCGFSGPLVSPLDCGSATNQTVTLVAQSGNTQFSYINTIGQTASANWNLNATPAGSATINGSSTTVSGVTTVTFVYNSSFESATLTAINSGGTSLTCESQLNIVKAEVPTPDCSCTPIFANEFYNYPNDGMGNIENALFFTDRSTCDFDWSNVDTVTIQVGGVYGVGSNSMSLPNIYTMGQTGGMANNPNWETVVSPTNYRNIKIRRHKNSSNVDPGFLRNNTLGSHPAWATIKFKNGCPDVLLYLNDDPDFSFIN